MRRIDYAPIQRLAELFPNGICLAKLRLAMGMANGAYLPNTGEPCISALANLPGVKILARFDRDLVTLQNICKKAGVRLNNIWGDPLK